MNQSAPPIHRIAFVLPNFQAGGAERVMVTVANHLDRSRFQPVIIAFSAQGPLLDIVAEDIQVINLNAERVSRGGFSFARAVHDHKIDLVISTMAHLNIIVLLMKPFMPHIPVIVREAVTPSYFSGNFIKRLVLSAAYCVLYPFADKILSPTKLVFEEMPGVLKSMPGKLVRIFNPVNSKKIRGDVDAALRGTLARADQVLFVGAGRLVDQKGFDRLIEVLRGWAARDDWRLVILGDGPEQERLQRLIDDNKLHQIRLMGFEETPWRYFAVADCFVLPSRHEGLPNVALEALAMGAPVIAASSAGGIAEIAAVAGDDFVRLSPDMDGFLELMGTATPDNTVALRESLLPECFALEKVVASYQRIFAECLQEY